MIRKILGGAGALLLAVTALIGLAGTADAAGTLGSVAWSLSRPHPGDTAVRYSWNFTVATTGSIKSVTATVPPDTAGASLTLVDAYGLPATGAASLSGTTVTYTLPSTSSVSAGVPVLLSLDGFTNTATTGSYASTVTTQDSSAATIDTGGSPTITINPNTTAVTVLVARSIAFTMDTTAMTLLMDPSVSALADRSQVVTATVATNAAGGYTLTTAIDHQLTGAAHAADVFAATTTGTGTGVTAGSFPADTFGYAVGLSGSGGTSIVGAGTAGGQYIGYTTGQSTIVSATAPTNLDTVTLTNRAKINYLQPADRYTGTITYTATPSY
jgi:hypothetical protein